MRSRLIALLLLGLNHLIGINSWADPDWLARVEGQHLEGNTLSIACYGEGMSLDLARKVSVDSCRSTARQYLQTTQRVRSLSVQTEQGVAFHEEVSELTEVSGLKCTPKKESNETKDGQVKVWTLCAFDLSAVVVSKGGDTLTKSDADSTELKAGGITNRTSLSTVGNRGGSQTGRFLASDRRQLTISTVPQCSSILVTGPLARPVQCKTNPTVILIERSDESLIVRAKDHEPKTVLLKEGLKDHDSIQVILDPL